MSSDIKDLVKKYWDKMPCGTRNIKYVEGTLEYYEAVSRNRYEIERWTHPFLEFGKWKGKRVLEVGCGVGSDLIEFAKQGAVITGMDLSPKSIELAGKRLELYKCAGNVFQGDAERIPFKDDTFDMVVSIGVLHHTPDIERAIGEIHRVLKEDGEIRIMLYHRASLVGLQMWLLYGLLAGNPFRKWDEIFYNHHESIGTKIYTVKEVKKMFVNFKHVEISTIVTMHDIRYARNKYLPICFKQLVPHCLGWNILIKGKK